MNALRAFWCKHGQKSVASLLAALAVVDLTPYADDFQMMLGGRKWHAALRIVGAGAIFWRALQR
jgi:hypothetical protein